MFRFTPRISQSQPPQPQGTHEEYPYHGRIQKGRPYILSLFIFFVLIMTVLTTYLLPAHAFPVQPHFNHFLSTNYEGDGQYDDNNPIPGSGTLSANLAQEQSGNLAYPYTSVSYAQTINAYNAYQSLTRKHQWALADHAWHLIGPITGNVPTQVTYTGSSTTASGRVTAIVVGSPCDQNLCRVWVGAAGGGVWEADNGLAAKPTWHSSSQGLASNAIGSIVIDPNDPTGQTLYVGTGEQNGSSDSEAGVGLYKSTNYGQSWTLVRGSVAVAKDRSIGAIAIDPINPLMSLVTVLRPSTAVVSLRPMHPKLASTNRETAAHRSR